VEGTLVVVVNYRTPKWLTGFVRSVTAHPPPDPWTLAVVDVDPEDAMPFSLLENSSFANLPDQHHYHYVDTNIGYAGACNLAWRLHRGHHDKMAFFNADVTITPGSLEHLCRHLDQHPDVGLVGPRQVASDGRITAGGILPGRDGRADHRGWRIRDNGHNYTDVVDAAYLAGSAIVARATVLDELADCPTYRALHGDAGPWLPTPLYYEDNWLSRHAAAHHHRVVYDGRVTIRHEWHQSPGDGWAVAQVPIARRIFIAACDAHDIPHGEGERAR